MNEMNEDMLYTDLACERRRADLDCHGIEYRKERNINGVWERIRIKSEAGARAMGKPMAIATSKPQALAEELLEKGGLIDYFDVICGALDEKNNAKWQVVTRAMEAFGAKPEELVLVGDTKYDVIGAHQCGVKCIGVEYGYAAAGELEESGADYIVKDMDELLKLISE